MNFWADEYPHEVNASVLLLDGEIYNWKIGNQFWEHPSMVKMAFIDMYMIDEGRFTVENKSFTVHNDMEHEEVFDVHAKEWFKTFKISDKHIFGKPY